MNEANVPSDDVKNLLDFLSKNKLIIIDKIIKPISELDIDFIDQHKLENIWNKLFNIEVKMIDDTKETDCFFIHE